jgi:hypothetical protein
LCERARFNPQVVALFLCHHRRSIRRATFDRIRGEPRGRDARFQRLAHKYVGEVTLSSKLVSYVY